MPTKRQVDALCHGCYPYQGDCGAPACPLYGERKANTGEAIEWWRLPKRQWETAERAARVDGILIPREEIEPTEAQIAARERFKAMRKDDIEP
jgi:hypothetical protein